LSNLTCGIDWADDHHDVAVVDAGGTVVAERRITNDPHGFAELVELLAACGEDPGDLVPVAIESSKGLFVAALVASGRQVFPHQPAGHVPLSGSASLEPSQVRQCRRHRVGEHLADGSSPASTLAG
jgi:Transposase